MQSLASTSRIHQYPAVAHKSLSEKSYIVRFKEAKKEQTTTLTLVGTGGVSGSMTSGMMART
jgi:hypothetical protein